MINLIPPQLRKTIVSEYWTRTISVWFLLLAAVGVVAIFLSLPVYVLLSTQVAVYEQSAAEAAGRITELGGSESELMTANTMAQSIIRQKNQPKFSRQVALLESLVLEGIELQGYDFAVDPQTLLATPVQVRGVAATRQALADYRDKLLAEATIEEVVLPISNLTRNKDIDFSITVTFKPLAP